MSGQNAGVPYHVRIWPNSTRQQTLGELYAFNVDEDELRTRFVEPYEQGSTITWSGRSIDAHDVATLHIATTDEALPPPPDTSLGEYHLFQVGRDVTNDWIKGPPGSASPNEIAEPQPVDLLNPKRVMVV